MLHVGALAKMFVTKEKSFHSFEVYKYNQYPSAVYTCTVVCSDTQTRYQMQSFIFSPKKSEEFTYIMMSHYIHFEAFVQITLQQVHSNRRGARECIPMRQRIILILQWEKLELWKSWLSWAHSWSSLYVNKNIPVHVSCSLMSSVSFGLLLFTS